MVLVPRYHQDIRILPPGRGNLPQLWEPLVYSLKFEFLIVDVHYSRPVVMVFALKL